MKNYYAMRPSKVSFFGLVNLKVTNIKKKILLLVIAISLVSVTNAQVIDIIGMGTYGNPNSNLNLTAIDNIDHVNVASIYKGAGGIPAASTVLFNDSNEGPSSTWNGASSIVQKGYPSQSIGYFSSIFNSADVGGIDMISTDTERVHSFYAHIFRNIPNATYKSFISPEVVFFYHNGADDPYVFNIPIETAVATRNVTIKIPITELDAGNRNAIIDITAGSIVKHIEETTYNLGNSFFLGEYVLEDVPGNIDNISISIYSPDPNAGEENGDSFLVSCIVADVDIVDEPIELEVCVKDLGNDLFSATFGYYNPNEVAITLDEGSSLINHNTGSSTSYEQNGILSFEPGTVENVFSRQFMRGEDVEWTVQSSGGQSRTAQASQSSNLCSVEKAGVIFPLYDQGDGKTEVVLGLDLNALAAGNAGTIPSPLIYQIKANKVLVEVIPKVGQLQAVLNLLQSDYALTYNTNPNLTDFIISPAQIVNEGISTIDVYFPINRLLELNLPPASQIINFVRVLSPNVNNTGIVTSQGDEAQKTNLVRDSYRVIRNGKVAAVDGTGIKIGVLSDSYNTQPFIGKSKAEVDVENGDLPGLLNPNGYLSEVEVLKEFPFGDGFDEGRAMLQIIHDVAPGAELAFHTGVVSPRDFELGIKALQDVGCTVIVDDITFPAEPFFDQGKIAQAIQGFTSIPGNSYITSAGNFSDKGYQSTFNASTNVPQTNFLPEDSFQKVHVFGSNPDGSQDIIQKISVVTGVYMLVLQWDEDLASQENSSGATDDLDFYLVDEEGRLIVGNNRVNDLGDPTEIMFFQATGTGEANIMITNASTNPSPNLPFRIIAFRSTGLEFLEYAGAPTVSGHAMTPDAITVGAVDYRETQNPESQFFSSKAGNLSNQSSTEVDLSAPDGVNTNVSSIGQDIDDDGFTNFFGTSAAAPHVAGAMALLQSAKASWYPDGLPISDLDLFKQSAVIFGQVEQAGAGLIDANNAFKQIATQTAKLIELVPEEGKVPSADSLEVTIVGKFFPKSQTISVEGEDVPSFKVLFNGVEIEAVLVSESEITANLEPFVGNPPLIVTTTGISPGGSDGGDSDPIFFFDGKIALNVIADDVDVLFGDDIEMSFSVEGLEDGVTFESLGLPPIVFTSPAVFPFPDVNNYIITPDFETPLTDDQLELFQINFIDGILAVSKRDLLITPEDGTYTYGEPITVSLKYEYNPNGISDSTLFLAAIENAHQTDFYPDNTLALINKFQALVNDYDILNLLNGGSWMSSERTIQNRFQALVNDMNVINLDIEHFTDYIDASNDGTTNHFQALLNKFQALVNAEDLFAGLVDLGIPNKFQALVNSSNLGGEDNLNDYTSTFVIVDAEDAPTGIEDRTISKFYSMNLITGLGVTTDESHYIFPGAFLAPIAANFNNFYDAGRITINPATLNASISDISIDKDKPVDFSVIQTELSGFVFDETIETVFPDGIPYVLINASGKEYEIGDVGEFSIKIANPQNYTIEYGVEAKLTINEPVVYEYCNDHHHNHAHNNQGHHSHSHHGSHCNEYNDDEHQRVVICHKGKTKCIPISAVQAHLNHGDSLGHCDSENDYDDHDDATNYEEDGKFKLFPNPVQTTLTIENKKSKKCEIFIYDVYGNLYKYKKLKQNKNEIKVDMRSYPDGIYIVRIILKNGVSTYNIIKN
ncbi:S8 family serine peptidase [Aureibaculum luteum]|uniref:S8 family serine peptidase n=1 Tax=Aureibaculum luteum TaxID=1548456 RepID=UPI000E4E3C45|nr:S8 family serine peptidase [Aureibaculum luteum]